VVNGRDHAIKGGHDDLQECELANCDNIAPAGRRLCRNHRNRASQYNLSDQEMVDFFSPGECEACGSKAQLAIHHDHSCCDNKRPCGKCVVALLCNLCNKAAGACGDDPERLRSLADVISRKNWKER